MIPSSQGRAGAGALRYPVSFGRSERWPFGSAPPPTPGGSGIPCEPGYGVIDFPAFKELLDGIGFDGFAIVEHGLFPCAFDVPLPIATRTRAYLSAIDFG